MIDVSQKMIYIVDGKSVKKIPYMRVPMIVLTSSTVETSRDVTAADSLPTQAFVVVRSEVGASCIHLTASRYTFIREQGMPVSMF